MQQLQNVIETAFERRADITPANVDTVTREAINHVIDLLDTGALRVAEKIDGQWVTHQWLKKAVLLSFRINDNQVMEGAETRYYDKVPMKFAGYDEARFQREGFRVVPPATVRKGAFIARNTVLMPSYVNIGAFVDEGTMVDTGQLWVLAHKSVRMFTCLAVLALVACWSHCKLTRPLSKTTALSAHVQKWSKGLSLKKARLFPWAYLSVKAPVFMIVKRVKSIMVAFPQALSLFQVICHQKMVATACTARLS